MIKNDISDVLSSILNVIKQFKTFEIGQLVYLCQKVDQQSFVLEDKSLSKFFIDFIIKVSQEARKLHSNSQKIALLILESFIYNMYQTFSDDKVGNSLYNNSLLLSSMSQLSMNDQSTLSMNNENMGENCNIFTTFLQDLISDQRLLKKLKVISERCNSQGQNLNQRYVQILMETIQYILEKQGKIQKEVGEFYEKKKNIISSATLHPRRNIKIVIDQVNEIIFSNKLNRIAFMLANAQQQIYFSLLRIYYCHTNETQLHGADKDGNKNRTQKFYNYFRKIRYSGKQMIQNICLNYVDSIQISKDLFEPSRHPFYKLISLYLMCFFAPYLRQFVQIVSKCCKIKHSSTIDFYKINQATISKDLTEFLELLPSQLGEFLNTLLIITKICEKKSSKNQLGVTNVNGSRKKEGQSSITPLTSVKKLLLYSFLIKPEFVELYLPQSMDINKYIEACNNLLNLFFQSSLKQYSPEKLSGEDYQLISDLTTMVSSTVDQRIVNFGAQDFYTNPPNQAMDLSGYKIEQPILNYDFQVLHKWIKSLQFSPKDQKQFQMKLPKDIKQISEEFTNNKEWGKNKPMPAELGSLSPMAKYKTNNFQNQAQSMEIFQSPCKQEEEIDLLTWMTIGGSRNYEDLPGSQHHIEKSQIQAKEDRKKLNFYTFSKDKLKQIKKLYSEFEKIVEQEL